MSPLESALFHPDTRFGWFAWCCCCCRTVLLAMWCGGGWLLGCCSCCFWLGLFCCTCWTAVTNPMPLLPCPDPDTLPRNCRPAAAAEPAPCICPRGTVAKVPPQLLMPTTDGPATAPPPPGPWLCCWYCCCAGNEEPALAAAIPCKLRYRSHRRCRSVSPESLGTIHCFTHVLLQTRNGLKAQQQLEATQLRIYTISVNQQRPSHCHIKMDRRVGGEETLPPTVDAWIGAGGDLIAMQTNSC